MTESRAAFACSMLASAMESAAWSSSTLAWAMFLSLSSSCPRRSWAVVLSRSAWALARSASRCWTRAWYWSGSISKSRSPAFDVLSLGEGPAFQEARHPGPQLHLVDGDDAPDEVRQILHRLARRWHRHHRGRRGGGRPRGTPLGLVAAAGEGEQGSRGREGESPLPQSTGAIGGGSDWHGGGAPRRTGRQAFYALPHWPAIKWWCSGTGGIGGAEGRSGASPRSAPPPRAVAPSQGSDPGSAVPLPLLLLRRLLVDVLVEADDPIADRGPTRRSVTPVPRGGDSRLSPDGWGPG